MSELKRIKLNTPTYREIIPSSKKEVQISPFKVGDEKLLLIASESKDAKQMIDGLKNVISSCVKGADLTEMAAYDVEYLFLKIRSISVGETATVLLTCTECETANEVKVDLSKIEVRNIDNFVRDIKVTDDLIFKMKTPDIDSYTGIDTTPDGIITFIARNVERVFYGEETIEVSQNEINDVIDIINQCTASQFADMQNYVQTMPKVSYDIEFICKECGHKNTRTLEGLADFF